MNHLHATFHCKNVEAYNKLIDCVDYPDDVRNEGLTIYVGAMQFLNKEKYEKLDDADYIIFARDDMMNPGFISVGGRFFDETQSPIEEAMGGEKYRDEWKEKETDKIFSRKEINEIIEDYKKDWE